MMMKLLPSDDVKISKNVGQLVVRFEFHQKDGSKASIYESGTAFLHYQISATIFVILTAASNFVKFLNQKER